MKTITFKCKTPSGMTQVSNLTDQNRLADLKAALTAITGINRLKVMHGYPPKELDLSKEEIQLGTLFSTLRESLIVSENVPTNIKTSTESTNRNTSTNIESTSNSKLTSNSKSIASTNITNGKFIRKVVPANNSCLFTAVYFYISNGVFDPEIGASLRKLIVTKVKEDPIEFNDAILGCPIDEYCEKILRDDVWAGCIELKILSNHYAVEIVAVDTQNVRVNRFGEDRDFKSMIFLIYDGIHYDALYLENSGQSNKQVTIFPNDGVQSSQLIVMALELAREAKSKGQFTDVRNFKLKCLACSDRFTGPQEANLHAKKTGHTNFGEF